MHDNKLSMANQHAFIHCLDSLKWNATERKQSGAAGSVLARTPGYQ
jgi:hypothetical protein